MDNVRVTEKAEIGTGWLVLIYRVPPEPTRLRSTVWRRIKSLGAIYLQNPAAARPANAANERALRKLRREIIEMSGTAVNSAGQHHGTRAAWSARSSRAVLPAGASSPFPLQPDRAAPADSCTSPETVTRRLPAYRQSYPPHPHTYSASSRQAARGCLGPISRHDRECACIGDGRPWSLFRPGAISFPRLTVERPPRSASALERLAPNVQAALRRVAGTGTVDEPDELVTTCEIGVKGGRPGNLPLATGLDPDVACPRER
jgi:hypothetical protein